MGRLQFHQKLDNDLGIKKFPVFAFLRPNTITQTLESGKFIIHSKNLCTGQFSTNVSIKCYLKSQLYVLNVTFYLVLELKA